MPVARRPFLAAATASMLNAGAAASTAAPRKRIAFIGTVVRAHSHPQHFLDRLVMGYSWAGGWQAPRLDVASVYIDQFPNADLGRGRIARHRLRQASSVADALTLGTSKLAVDGVAIIGEHGQYPVNAKGQRRYPRYQWFQEVVKIFEATGRSCPVFNDKHLSTDWSECL
jgi:hypothetical protein